jgi:hypothetical protein
MDREHLVTRREEYVAGTRERPEAGIFTQTHSARPPVPWGRIGAGEKVWMKWAGGPVVAVATVTGLRQFDQCTPDVLRASTAGFKLHDLPSYWASLPPVFFGLVVLPRGRAVAGRTLHAGGAQSRRVVVRSRHERGPASLVANVEGGGTTIGASRRARTRVAHDPADASVPDPSARRLPLHVLRPEAARGRSAPRSRRGVLVGRADEDREPSDRVLGVQPREGRNGAVERRSGCPNATSATARRSPL